MNPAMMNPDMMKAAQKMMSKMSPDDMNRMMEMSKNMDPKMMQQAQNMMSNPAMAKQAAQAMEGMSSDDMKSKIDMAAASGAAPRAPPAVTKTAAEKLKASLMSVPDDVIERVENAEAAKKQGNDKFKGQEFGDAADHYSEGAALVASVINGGTLSGSDKQAVLELMDACHLNNANCQLKLEDFDAAVDECSSVLDRGANRKAHFRRGCALQKLKKLDEAREDLKKAIEMDPNDAIVAATLKEVESSLGVKPTKVVKTPAPAAAPSAPMPMMPGMPSDPKAMDEMLDKITPEQMKQQAEMLENMDPAQLSAMAPQLGGVDPSQLKMVSEMMKNMEPEDMKNMAKMAQQMQGSMGGMGGMMGGTGSAGNSSDADGGGVPDMANMSMDKGMEMMENMNPDMMKAGMNMMKNMDPKAMASMSKAMGREVSEDQMKQMQGMMDKMSPEDMQKWSKRASTAASWMKRPVAAFQACRATAGRVGTSGFLAIGVGLLAVMAVGHFTELY